MYKLFVFAALLAVATAAPGYIGAPLAAPLAAPWGHGVVSPYAPLAAPWGHGVVSPYAPVVKAAVPVATSYSNSVRIATPAVVAAHAPVVAHAPAYVSPYAHAW